MQANDPIFLRLNKNYTYLMNSGTHIFFGNDKNQFFDNEVFKLVEPSIDSTFKYIFDNSGCERLKNMLNSILFPDNPKIIELQFLNNEVVKINRKNNKGMIRADILCKVLCDNENIIIGIQIQLGNYGDFSKRLFNYNSEPINNNEKTWAIGLFINVGKCPIYSIEENGGKKVLNLLDIVEIDLSEEIEKINSGKEIYINNKKLGDYGKEWIKLLGLRTWCPREFDRFILPKNYLLSNNSLFNEAIEILCNIPSDIIESSIILDEELQKYLIYIEEEKEKEKEKGKREGIIIGRIEGKKEGKIEGEKEGRIKALIKISFELFQNNCEEKMILNIINNEKFNEKQIHLVLNNCDLTKSNNYIQFLLKNNLINDEFN